MADIKAVDLKTDAMTTPLGLDDQRPSFSWKLKSSGPGTLQASYRIGVYSDSVEDKLVWDSGVIQSGRSTGILYGGKPLKPATRYFWMVSGTDISGNRFQSRLSWFETGLMGTGKDVWDGAEWIGSYKLTANADAVTSYRFQTDFFLESGSKAGIILAARNKDNFILFEIDLDNRLLTLKEFCDNAWDGSMAEGNIPTETTIGRPGGYPISTDAIPAGKEQQLHRLVIEVRDRELSVFINNCPIIWKRKDTMPKAGIFTPRRSALMNVGFRQLNSRAAYRHVIISDINTRSILQRDDFSTETGVLSGLGKVKNGSLFVVNRFELVSPVPAVNLKRSFLIAKKVANARLYAAARGFYEAYLNGSRTDDGFYHPGFTDYRLRIAYQTFDVTALLKQGINTLTVMVAKGYFSGFCGYCGPCIYGTQNSFIGKLVITYSDGTKQIVVTDENWLFTDKGPVTDADYLDGETYDARLENALFEPEEALADPGSALSARNDTPAVPDGPAARESIMPAGKDHKNSIWRRCGVHPWPERPSPTNGTFDKEIPFLLSSQCGPYARAERILDPISIHETQPGHFVYDFGQNMVGTVRLRVRGKQGQSLKLRYGEMCYPNGEIYIKNLRSAANTDTYTLKGSHVGETFIPSFTAHGFRYVEITGNGELLENNDCILSLEGVVITNAPDVTGHFECSDPLVNQLQSNIQWGERCNFLLVPTDCPQRNERFGWTGDAQVFASTAAFNMDIEAFMNKWLQDVRDSQLMYNREGAVPDTAPLGGDNRPAGCAGWGDAAVIVPWKMYLAYGNKQILEDNYSCMQRWIAYQSLESRQNYGLRTVGHIPLPEESDLASIPFIQVQQSRGDHLSYDLSTPFILTATAYAAHVAKLMSNIAHILKKWEDERMYRERFSNIRQAFREAWVMPDGSLAYWGEMSRQEQDESGAVICRTRYSDLPGSTHHPSQTAYALAIDFDLMPENTLAHTYECFARTVESRDCHLSVGFLGISHLLPALSKAGRSDLSYRLLLQKGNPGWLYSVINGATTIWERWNSYIAETGTFGDVSMNSFNHYAYGSVGEWIYRTVLGISCGFSPEEAGYRHIILKPVWNRSLTYARGSLDSPCGLISSGWEYQGDQVVYRCTIPDNSTAELILPSGSDGDGKKQAVIRHTLLPGTYEFTVPHAKP